MHRGLEEVHASPAWIDFIIVLFLIGELGTILSLVICLGLRQRVNEQSRKKSLLKQRTKNRAGFERKYKYEYQWDLVIVFKESREDAILENPSYKKSGLTRFQRENNRKHVLHCLRKKGLIFRQFFSIQDDEIYCKVRAPLKLIKRTAHDLKYKIKFDPVKLQYYLSEDHPDQSFKKIELKSSHIMTRLRPYDYLYGAYHLYTASTKDVYQRRARGMEFRDIDRLRLIYSILEKETDDMDEADQGSVRLKDLLTNECVVAYGGVHDYTSLLKLQTEWTKVARYPGTMDLTPVKDYFGEKIGLYVAFTEHLSAWLIPIAAAGVLAWIHILYLDNDPNAPDIPYFAAIVALWATLMLEFWKRQERYLIMQWGVSDFEEREDLRPEFDGVEIPSPIDGKTNYRHFTLEQATLRRITVALAITAIIGCVVISILSLFVFGAYLRGIGVHLADVDFVGIIIAIIQSVLIAIYDRGYTLMAEAFSSYENHRTDTMHDDSVIFKVFVFRFFNNFSPMLYIAFIKPYLNDIDRCRGGNCMEELKISVATLFISKMIINSTVGVLSPAAHKFYNKRINTAGISKSNQEYFTEIEREFMRPEYTDYDGSIADFAETATVFGLSTFFISAFPLAIIVGAAYSFVDMRIFAWKLCCVYRRPHPRCAQSIGSWNYVLEIVSITAVLSNSGIVAFTGTFANEYDSASRVWIFIGMSVLILSIKLFLSVLIPNYPSEVTIQLKRQNFISRKIVLDEKYDDVIRRTVSSIGNHHLPSVRLVRAKIQPSISNASTSSTPSHKRSVFNDFRSTSREEPTPILPKVELTDDEKESLEREEFIELFLMKIRENDNEMGADSHIGGDEYNVSSRA